MILVLSWNESQGLPALNTPALKRLGETSYGIYLVSPFTIFLAIGYSGTGPAGEWISAAIALLGSVAAARLLFQLYEQPFLRLKNRFSVIEAGPRPA
jgi:peptidoglycan/LPS O-acetylase OafA/YrhL